MLSEPVDIQFETYVLQFYREIVKGFSKAAEKMTTLEVDLAMLAGQTNVKMELTAEQRFAVIYRSERKQILRSQLELAEFLLQLLNKVSKPCSDKAFKHLYLSPLPSEQQQMHNGQFTSLSFEHEYQVRRLFLRRYLLCIFKLV